MIKRWIEPVICFLIAVSSYICYLCSHATFFMRPPPSDRMSIEWQDWEQLRLMFEADFPFDLYQRAFLSIMIFAVVGAILLMRYRKIGVSILISGGIFQFLLSPTFIRYSLLSSYERFTPTSSFLDFALVPLFLATCLVIIAIIAWVRKPLSKEERKEKKKKKLVEIQEKIAAKGTELLLLGMGLFILGIVLLFCFLFKSSDLGEDTLLIGLYIVWGVSSIGSIILTLTVAMLCIEKYKEYKRLKELPTREEPEERLLEPLMGLITGSFLILIGLLLFHPGVARGYQIGGEVNLAFEISVYILTGIIGIIGGIVVRKYRKVGAPLLFFNGLLIFYHSLFSLAGLIFCLAGIFALIRKSWSKEEVERIKSKLR